MTLRSILLCCVVAAAAAARLRIPGNASASTNASANASSKKLNASHPQRNLTDLEKIEKLQDGLKSIQNVEAMFVARHRAEAGAPAVGAQKFADGALTEELSNQESPVWAAIAAMVNSTQRVMSQMKGKSKDEQKKMMESLEAEMDTKAGVLHNVTEDAGKKQVVQDEEYVLGLLNMHKSQWNMTKQLETVKKFMGKSPKLAELYAHHDDS